MSHDEHARQVFDLMLKALKAAIADAVNEERLDIAIAVQYEVAASEHEEEMKRKIVEMIRNRGKP